MTLFKYMLASIADFLLELLDKVGYLGIFFATAIESFFAPIPSEIVLITAGLYAKTNGGIPALFLVAFVAALGSFVGTLPFYLISRYGSETFLPKFLKKWGAFLLISPKDLEKAHKLFEKRGSVMVFVSRLIPGIRSLISFPAGVAKMNFAKYTFYTILGSFSWNIILATVGYLAYDSKDKIFQFLDPFQYFILALLILGCLFYSFKVAQNFVKIRREN